MNIQVFPIINISIIQNKFPIMILKILWNKLKFPFLVIWKNDDIKYNNTEIIKNFFDNIKIYIDSENYIKVQNKPVITLKNERLLKRTQVKKFAEMHLKEKIASMGLELK